VNDEQEDFIIKLLLIEHEANAVLEDLPPGLMRDRVQHIATTAKLLKARLQVAAPLITRPQPAHKPDGGE
jgi:hypothetical protein